MERLLNELVGKLKKAYGGRLVSVVLYGSGASGENDTPYSDINILCVLNEVGPRELADSTAVFQWWRAKRNPSPLLLSVDELNQSTDCFPIEFHDMRERRRILYGSDLIGSLIIDDCFYRAQLEYQLRAKLLRLRQKVGGVLTDPAALRTLLTDSVSTFCVLLRHTLLLAGHAAPVTKRQVVADAAGAFEFDPAPFNTLLDLREQKIKPREVDPGPLLAAYMEQIKAVIDAVDRLET